MKRVRKAWNGGSREAALAAANAHRDDATAKLRVMWQQTAAQHPWLCSDPFMNDIAPGWVYLPIEDCVILEETVRALREMPR